MRNVSSLIVVLVSIVYVGCANTSQQRTPNQVSTDFGKNIKFDQKTSSLKDTFTMNSKVVVSSYRNISLHNSNGDSISMLCDKGAANEQNIWAIRPFVESSIKYHEQYFFNSYDQCFHALTALTRLGQSGGITHSKPITVTVDIHSALVLDIRHGDSSVLPQKTEVKSCGLTGPIEQRINDCSVKIGNFNLVSRKILHNQGGAVYEVYQDSKTRLIWSERFYKENNKDAANKCNTSNPEFAGLTGLGNWKLPTKEDYTTADLNGIGSLPRMDSEFWTSSPVKSEPWYTWVYSIKNDEGTFFKWYTQYQTSMNPQFRCVVEIK
jgi:hypothetical protein